MDIIKKRFVLPPAPQPPSSSLPVVYPWENINLYNLCVQLYELAKNTGYNNTFDDFKEHFGALLENQIITADDIIYKGQDTITPLPLVEQILDTYNKFVKTEIVIEPIPYRLTSNMANGYTAIIG